MKDPFAPIDTCKNIASVTVKLLETRDGVRYCDTNSVFDETQMPTDDIAKFQFHCLHWFAAMQQLLVLKLGYQHDRVQQELRRQADELKLVNLRVQALGEKPPTP